MNRLCVSVVLAPALIVGCATLPERSTKSTLAELREVQPDLQEAEVEKGLEQAMESYRRFLEEAPETAMTPEAMRRLADLEIEKQYGIRTGEGTPREMAAPAPGRKLPASQDDEARQPEEVAGAGAPESEDDFELRTTADRGGLKGGAVVSLPEGALVPEVAPEGPLEAIALYDRLLTEYPAYEHNDQVLYQKARAYDELGRTEEALEAMEILIRANPGSVHFDEVQFRRGEYFFMRKRFRDAESAFSTIIDMGTGSSYYELALYKLGWTLYKQEFYEEALHEYMALLDYKVSSGYDFDEAHSEDDERRVTDTYRVVSLSFSNLGGSESVQEYFTAFGNRSYEDRVYGNLGEHYLAKLRYNDAAKTYRTFVELNPFHRSAPHFGMRLVETFTQGGFPKLVLESKREFASKYGLQSEYWRHFSSEEMPDVVAYLKTNLTDLATHYHAEYQGAEEEDPKQASYREARRWYGDYLESFPTDDETPPINYRLADLLLENQEFGEAARQYEHTAYGYLEHPQAADAGYAAVYAYREQLKAVAPDQEDEVRGNVVTSSLRFVDTFQDHESAAAILGAAADDQYEMKAYRDAITSAQRLIDSYPGAETALRRSAWMVVAHGSFELAEYPQAENGYGQVLALTSESDESRAGLVDNLAASIYKQGELAREAQDFRAAADNFLRVRAAAPDSNIRAAAEYDAGAALMELAEWSEAAEVLDAFRRTYPLHDLVLDATRQIAYAFRESGDLLRAADEYDRIAMDSLDPGVRSEALLVAGDLYEQSGALDRALAVYSQYVSDFPEPLEPALETRFKMAKIYEDSLDDGLYLPALADIVMIEENAGPDRTVRTRTIASRSALVLAERVYQGCVAVKLLQPFEESLVEKRQRMDATIEAMGRLVDYEIAEVTAAATYYMAETYLDFSRALNDSERPADLDPESLREYERVLVEEARPFADDAVSLHEKNLEMLHAGVTNDWTRRSILTLVELVPGRYAKNEVSIGSIGAIDGYVYRTPASQIYEQIDDERRTAAAGGVGEPGRSSADGGRTGENHEKP